MKVGAPPAVVSVAASAMNAWLIQSQWGIAIAVIASERRAALMLLRWSPVRFKLLNDSIYLQVA